MDQQEQDETINKFIEDENKALEDRTRLNLENNHYAQKDDTESSHEESSTLSNTEHHQKKSAEKLVKEESIRIVG